MEAIFKGNPNFKNVYVKGEVSDKFISDYGHLYFTLKDKKSEVPCIVYKWFRKNIKFDIENGMKLLVMANVVVYVPHGKYQLDVRSVTEDGLGQLFVKYSQLKKKLENEGLFDDKHKKELPNFVKKIGVVTSKGGSVIHDIIKTVEENWPYCNVYLFPAAVQGTNSKNELVTQIRRADNFGMDVLIVARGGGSLRDLWSYNEESVVRTIFNCKTPVISAIGHEDDTTLSDLVSDRRASTPTMAASLAIEDKNNILENIKYYNSHLIKFISTKLSDYRKQMDFILSKSLFADSTYVYKSQKDNFDDLCIRFDLTSNELVNSRRVMLDKISTEYVIRHPCKIQLDSSRHSLDELQTRLIDSMNLILKEYRVNLDKTTDNFKFHSKNLITSKNHELEIIESYFSSNPCQSIIDMSKNNLNMAHHNLVREVNAKIDSNKSDLELMSTNFTNISKEIILKNTHRLDSIRNMLISNPYSGQIDFHKNNLFITQDKIKGNVNVKLDSNKRDLDLMKNKFHTVSSELILKNSHRLDSIKNVQVIKNPERLYQSQKMQLYNIKNEKIFENPYLILDSYKNKLNVHQEKLDKIGQIIELKKAQQKQKETYIKIIVVIVIIMIIILILILGGIL